MGPKCLFGRYVAQFFLFTTAREKVMKIYDRVWNEWLKPGLLSKMSQCERPHSSISTIFGIEINGNGSLEPCQEKMARRLAETEKR